MRSFAAEKTPVVHQQRVLDAGVALLITRQKALDQLRAGRAVPGAAIVAHGDLNAWMMRDSSSWRHVLSTRPVTSADALEQSMPNNRRLLAAGLQMVSVFDTHGTEPGARRMLQGEPGDVYQAGCAPIQMRLVDHRRVLLNGFEQPRSILQLTTPAGLAAALHYWRAVRTTTSPVERQDGSGDLTSRQRSVLTMLADGLSDTAIADTLGVCPRTVRTEVAAIMHTLKVRTRFALGYAARDYF